MLSSNARDTIQSKSKTWSMYIHFSKNEMLFIHSKQAQKKKKSNSRIKFAVAAHELFSTSIFDRSNVVQG